VPAGPAATDSETKRRSKTLADRILSNGTVSEAVWWKHYNALEDWAKQKARLDNDKKKLIKACRDDGVDPDDFKDINKTRAMALAEFIDKHNRNVRMMRMVRHPAAQYMQEIDPTLSDETGLTDEQRQTKWEDHGYVAGRAGKTLAEATEGHDPNSETGRWIIQGFENGKNALGTRQGNKGPEPVAKQTESKPLAETAGKITPKQEPEVAAAKGRGKGVTYWHHAERRQVFEVGIGDTPAPEGSVAIRKPEYEKLKIEYDAEFDASAPPTPPGRTPADDGFDLPPTPSKH
jgi:hypothetical protein